MADYIPTPLSPEPKPDMTRWDQDEAEILSDRHTYVTCEEGQPVFHARVDNGHSSPPEIVHQRPDSHHGAMHHPDVIERSNKIIIYPFPGDIPPSHLRELMQSTIGPVRAVTMICVTPSEVAAEVWFVRDDASRACRKCPTWSVLLVPRRSTLRPEECVAAHQRRMGSGFELGMRRGGHVVIRQKEVVGQRQGSVKTPKRAARRKRASTRSRADHLAHRLRSAL